MRIAIVAPLVSPIREPQRGGAQAFLAELARRLVERGHDVHLYAASGSDVPGVEVIDTGVDHRELAATLYRATGTAANESTVAERAFARVYALVREDRYDVVHNHAFDAPAISLASALGAPLVHTIHLPPDRDVAGALRDASRGGDGPAVACVSVSHASAWRKVVAVEAILPPFIPTELIPFSLAAGAGAVFAGRLSPEKGAAEAIAIARMARIPIDVYGDRYDEDYARMRIDPMSAEPEVVVRRGVPQMELWQAIVRAAVVLCPARWEEPFGMVAAEAQACGTPVVAFQRGALGEVVIDGETGFLVTPDDLRAAADAVGDAATLSRRACREHAETNLDIERSVDAHEHLYQRLPRTAQRTRVRG